MLNTMKSWLDEEKTSHVSLQLKLSMTKVMVGMMMVDEHMDEYEHDAIMSFLVQNFHLSLEESAMLIESETNILDDAEAFATAAQLIVDSYSVEECGYVLSVVWRIALVDGEITYREEEYLNRLAGLLNVPEARLCELKKEQECDFPNLDERNRYEEF